MPPTNTTQNTNSSSNTNGDSGKVTNPYLDNPKLNYEIDKAKRMYDNLTMWYNLPEIKWADPNDTPAIDTTSETVSKLPEPQQTFQNNDFFNSFAMSSLPTQRNNVNNSRLTKLQASLIYGTLKTNLKTFGQQKSDATAENVNAVSVGGSPEVKFSENISENAKPIETTAEKIENLEEALDVIEHQKPAPIPTPVPEKQASTVNSFIGNFKVYGYLPSTGILNKLIKAANPQDAWKNFEPSSAKAWLYALTARLLAIHDGK